MSVILSVCVFAFFSAISKPTGTPFGTKLPLGPGMVLKQQYLGKRKKCGNAARNTSILAVLVKYLGHFETDLDAFWHEITFWSCEGCKTSILGKTAKNVATLHWKCHFERFSLNISAISTPISMPFFPLTLSHGTAGAKTRIRCDPQKNTVAKRLFCRRKAP